MTTSSGDTTPATPPIPADAWRPEPQAAVDRLLLDRIRLGIKVVLAGVVAVFVGGLVVRGIERPTITAIQGLNIAATGLLLGLLGPPVRRRRNLLLVYLGYVVTTLCTAGVGIVAQDATTTLVVMVAVALGAAAIVPWGPAWQLAGVLVTTAASVWTILTLLDGGSVFVLESVGSIVPTLAATVVVSHLLLRQVTVVAYTDHERSVREARLREAKGRLEVEVEERRRTEVALRFTLRELDHRVRNTLATVQAVADRTLESSQSMEQFAESFTGRIQSMARVHTALAAQKWQGLEVRDLVELVVDPHRRGAGRVSIRCDEGAVPSDLARILGMALHELTTNAAKYGALSTREGRVEIATRFETASDARSLRLTWTESNGPLVHAPRRRGVGTTLIERGLAFESGGIVNLRFPPSGVACDIAIPLAAGS